ncbi:MAG: outer membrane protein assembly factor BamC [Granulosicoccus sp.]
MSALNWQLQRPSCRYMAVYRGSAVGAMLFLGTLLAGCSSLVSLDSPDLIYTEDAEQARALQIPPDLTNLNNAEQFVLPGIGGGALTRNTLLPELDSIRFVRQGAQSWLAFEQTPENLWPRLLAFARDQGFVIETTEPTAGTIVSRWQAASLAARSGLLQNLLGADEQFTRIAFRLERDINGARLFARSQAASEELASATAGSEFAWPADSHDPESTSALLAGFLVFLGVTEQRARGILGQEQADAVLRDAALQTNAAGSQLLLNYGFQSSFERVVRALESLDYDLLSTDDGLGRIEFSETGVAGDVPALVIALASEHISAVTLSLTDASGQRLPEIQESVLLRELLAELS